MMGWIQVSTAVKKRKSEQGFFITMATFHIVMYPWFAMGHITPFLNLANKLAERGHKISFLLPAKTKQKFEPFNLHPDLINLIPITVPHVDGLPPGTETTADVLPPLYPLVMTAMDLTEPTIEASLRELQPQFVFLDTCHWLLELSQQFQELVLGFELTGLPFLAALKPPMGFQDVESALPEGFEDRVKGKGFVHGGWVQQQLILKHPSVGCFVTHCGWGSLWEAMVNECQLVLLPHFGDQIINARMMGGDMRVGVEVQKGEDGFFTRESVCKAVMAVMDAESKLGKEVKANHDKWREFLLTEGLENSYIDNFVEKLRGLL
ncbi:hypothetical protein SLEP1_g38533 [Rubroshorea leprosula]|nr:hypothetical protein SLEP1_g38533 [Rubroshorea leprosula]